MYIGIDLGTSSVKLILCNKEGEILNIVSREYPVMYPEENYSEQDPYLWYEKTVSALKDLTENIDKTQVKGISFGGQMHGLVILDKDDNVIRPCILWNDNRTVKENDYLNNVIGKEKLSSLTGNISFTGFTAGKLLWLKENERDNFDKISKIMLPKDYLVYRLTGIHATDPSDASGTLLFDVKNKCWSEEMLEICSVRKEQLPKIYESYEIIGNLKDDVEKELGFKNVKVVMGGGDNAMSAIATGTIGKGKCTVSLGTSGTVFISNDEFVVDENNALHSFAHSDGGYHLMGCILSAASCNKWWIENILQTDNYKEEEERINILSNNNLFFLPYLTGERSPHNDPFAKGCFVGITPQTKREDMSLAILEGVAFALKDCFEVARDLGINIREIKITGGGAKSSLWKKIIANVLNVDVLCVETEQGPSLGGAYLAIYACEGYDNLNNFLDKFIHIKERIKPEKELTAKYEEKYLKFKRLYPEMKNLFKIIS